MDVAQPDDNVDSQESDHATGAEAFRQSSFPRLGAAANSVLTFLLESGAATLDDVVARIPSPPHELAEQLTESLRDGFIAVRGPKTITDFANLIESIQAVNGYNSSSADNQRRKVLEHLVHSGDFTRTVIAPTRRAFALTLA